MLEETALVETAPKEDIHELKLLVGLCFDIVIPMLKKVKADGKFSVAALLEFMSSEEFKNDFGPAIKDIGTIGAEFRDFGIDDTFDLVSFLLVEAKKVVEVYTK